MSVYYNEYDRRKAAWLRHLIEEGEIAHGVVDERSIHAVQPEDLHGFAQCHFFAGIGLWSLCLRRAGWPDDRPVWTGSCPCGPFSIAGKQEGFDDPRHLWPEWFRLIRKRRPGFVADADNAEWWTERAPWHDGDWPKTGRFQGHGHLGDGRSGVGLADTHGQRLQRLGSDCDPVGRQGPYIRQAGLLDGAGVDWLLGTDEWWRPIEPRLSPLVDAYPRRVDLLRGYGDAIDVETFTNLIGAYMDVAP